MREERILIIGIILAAIVVSVLVLWALEVPIWPFSDAKVNCCTSKMLPNAQCAEVTEKLCEKIGGQVVEKCEDCMPPVTQHRYNRVPLE